MKQIFKNEGEMLELINKIQALLIVLDKKVDVLMRRSLSEPKPSLPSLVDKIRPMHTAICADCKKECTIPFKPSPHRPVYCQDCFSRRKVIKLSGISVANKLPEVLPVQTPAVKPAIKTKKTAVRVKKPVGKKKPASKKK